MYSQYNLIKMFMCGYMQEKKFKKKNYLQIGFQNNLKYISCKQLKI